MVELFERRVTRSLSNELQTRPTVGQAQAQAPAQSQPPLQSSFTNSRFHNRSNSHALANGTEADDFSFEPLPYCRTTSEEIFIRTLVDGAITQSNPSMEGLGLSNLPQASRKNSEELFSTWISSPETQGFGSSTSPYRTRQVSRRTSSEIGMAMPQQLAGPHQQLNNPEQNALHMNSFFADDMFGDQLRPRTDGGEKASTIPDLAGLQANSAPPWLQHSQPMTRSRSSELRRMYAAMQGPTVFPSADTLQRLATQGTHGLNQAVASLGAFARGLANGRVPQSPQVMQHPQSPNSVPPVGSGDSLSNMVSMLKGSLERKKVTEGNLHPQTQQMVVGVSSPCRTVRGELDSPQLFSGHPSNATREIHTQMGDQVPLGGVASNGHMRLGLLTNAVSPSESSGGAPTLSAGGALSDGPSNSGTVSTQQNTLKRAVQGGGAVDQPSKRQNNGGILPSPNSHRSGEGQFEGFQKTSLCKKPEQLTRAGSIISSGRSGLGLDNSNPTKMRRVERREKMLEAKGRPVLPSDLQVAIKRCDALEKEVRSLKLTVSFMNRKDSEQTKRIEELEKENQELQQEKEHLLEELERLASGHCY